MKLAFLIFLTLPSFSYGASRDFNISFYLDKNSRVEVLNDLYRATKSRYALWEIKKVNAGIDGDKVFQKYIQAEETIPEINVGVASPFEISKANIEFMDRVQSLVSSFKDTHFGMSEATSKNKVFNGMMFERAEGEILVSKMYKALLEKAEKDSGQEIYENISVGDRLIKIDGRDVEDILFSYAEFIDASSNSYRSNRAVSALTFRDFQYPQKYFSDFTIYSSKLDKEITIRLPWYVYNKVKHPDVATYMKEVGIERTEDFSTYWDGSQWKYKFLYKERKGRGSDSHPENLIAKKLFVDKDYESRDVVVTGYLIKESKVYGYLQILSFSSDDLKNSEDDEESSFKDVVTDFVKELKSQEVDLIIDLRNNGGGSAVLAGNVLEAIAKDGETYAHVTYATKLTSHFLSLGTSYASDTDFFNPENPQWWANYERAIEEAYHSESLFSKAFSTTTHESEIGGYEQKVVALISPSCISACDIASALLRNSGRATLVGSHSNGTGAGFNGGARSSWADNYGLFDFRIPNILFGKPRKSLEVGLMEQRDSYLTQNMENRPVEADVFYETTKEDLENGLAGWVNKAIEVLEQNPN